MKKVFINLSNHPSSNWNAKQKAAALELAEEIMDIQFPNVAPEHNVEQVAGMVTEILLKIAISGVKWQDAIIHVMGEATFVVQMALQTCAQTPLVCSTTERVSVEKEDGTKVSTFTFCKFRNLR